MVTFASVSPTPAGACKSLLNSLSYRAGGADREISRTKKWGHLEFLQKGLWEGNLSQPKRAASLHTPLPFPEEEKSGTPKGYNYL